MTNTQEAAKIILWLGESIGFWMQTGAFFLSALGAVAVIYANNATGRRRATIDLVMHQKGSEKFREARRVVKSLTRDGNACTKFFDNHESDEYKSIMEVLNSYEFVASGIKESAFDEGIYKRMQYSILTSDWDSLHGFVAEIRNKTNIETLYQEFEWLANKWKDKPLKSSKK